MLKSSLLGACLAVSATACVANREPGNDMSARQIVSSDCPQHTGTRIRLRTDQCSPLAGQVYTRDEINRTGAPTLSEALSQLDPALTIRR